MNSIIKDLQVSIRLLFKSPGFAFAAIFTLALGIGAVTSVFSVVDSVLLKPFAFPDPDRLVMLRETSLERDAQPGPDSYRHYLNWVTNSRSLADAAIFGNESLSISQGNDHPGIVSGLKISPNFFSVIGVAPAQGRSFLSLEATKGQDHVVILTWEAWQRYFHGDPCAIGRTLRTGDVPQTVVGILPQGFSFPHMSEMTTAVSQREAQPYEIFTPLVPDANDIQDGGNYNFLVIGRLLDGVSLMHTQSELAGMQGAFSRSAHFPYTLSIFIEPLNQEVSGKVGTALWLLLAAVGTVLLISCVNLANLQIARAVAREREIAVRAALGASRRRLLWSGMSETW